MHHHHNHFHRFDKTEDSNLIKLATYFSASSAALIIFVKIIGWLLTDSLTILASLTDSLLDIVASLINVLAIRYALQPPDNEHRFGHGKAEDLAIFSQSAFFSVSGIFLVIASIRRFISPQPIEHSTSGIVIMIISIIITGCLISFQRYVIKRTNSGIVKADHLHYVVDLLSNLAVIAALALGSILHNNLIDPLFSLFIATYILYGAWELLQRAFKNLMDHEFDDKEKEKILEIIEQHNEVFGLHDLRTRYAGSKPFIQFHLEMSGDVTLREAHRISEEIELKIIEYFPEAELIIHQDPVELYNK